MAKRSVFDQRNIEVVEPGSAERVAPERPEASVIRPGPPGNVDWNTEEGRVVRAQPEVVFAHGPARREMWCGNQVGPIGASRARARLLDPRIHTARRSRRQR